MICRLRGRASQTRPFAQKLIQNENKWIVKCPHYRLFLQWRHNKRDGVSNTELFAHNNCQIKENIKARRHWPLWGESICNRWIPLTKGQLRGKCFNLMTSSCCDPRLPVDSSNAESVPISCQLFHIDTRKTGFSLPWRHNGCNGV